MNILITDGSVVLGGKLTFFFGAHILATLSPRLVPEPTCLIGKTDLVICK